MKDSAEFYKWMRRCYFTMLVGLKETSETFKVTTAIDALTGETVEDTARERPVIQAIPITEKNEAPDQMEAAYDKYTELVKVVYHIF